MEQPGDAVMAVDPADAVYRAGIQSSGLINRILDLQASFDVFDGRSNKGDGPSREDSCHAVTHDGEFRFYPLPRSAAKSKVLKRTAVEKVLIEASAVEGQAPEHDAVHEHPSDERRGGALV